MIAAAMVETLVHGESSVSMSDEQLSGEPESGGVLVSCESESDVIVSGEPKSGVSV